MVGDGRCRGERRHGRRGLVDERGRRVDERRWRVDERGGRVDQRRRGVGGRWRGVGGRWRQLVWRGGSGWPELPAKARNL